MIGLDTNVLVRFITQDDAVQTPIATRLVESFTADEPGFISLVTLAEMIWVLRSFYDAPRERIQRVIETLLRSSGLRLERSDLVWIALHAYSRGTADFADYLIERCGHDAGCDYSVTFDRDAAVFAGMKLLR
jgi:predicted nucleic-acid-binding protein